MRSHRLRRRESPSLQAFSLVEVVLALGIVSFSLIGMLALLLVAVKTDNSSSQTVAAADMASLLISQRRMMPTNVIDGFALTNVDVSVGNFTGTPLYVTTGGYLTNQANAAYGMTYQIQASSSSVIDLILYWPAQAQSLQTASGQYEVVTEIALPH